MIIYDNTWAVLLDIEVDDTSVRYKAIKGENSLTLKFSLDEHVEVPIGSYAYFKDEKYILMAPQNLILKHRRNFEYTLIMHSEEAKAKRYKFRNPVDKRLKFSLTAKPEEHLKMFVDNMNMRDSGWEVGDCPDHVEISLAYNHTSCHDALVQLADALELDYWFTGKVVSLGKLELNKDKPLLLSYGGDGEGLKENIKRTNYADTLPIEVLYVQGSSTNIDSSRYRVEDKPVSELHLPLSQTIGYDGTYFEDEEGYDESKAKLYKTDELGLLVQRADNEVENHSEDSLDCSDITPTKEETIEGVWHVDAEKHFWDIEFSSTVDYSLYQIGGETPTVIFQKGMLAGKEFEVATDDSGKIVFYDEHGKWRMELVPQEIDGITMPDEESGYIPKEGDTFKFFGIQLPDEYICDNETKSGAEWEMFRYAVKYMHPNEYAQYTITGTLDEIYASRDWDNIKNRIQLGNYISFSDKSFQEEPLLIRIIGIKEFVNKPKSPVLEFSNQSIGGTLVGTLNRFQNEEVVNENMYNQSLSYTKRRFRSAQETLTMLQSAFKNFSEGINPVTVQTMAMLVGDESLQFKFIPSLGNVANSISPAISYDATTKQLKVGRQTRLMHMTLGIEVITAPSARTINDYLKWVMPVWQSDVLTEGTLSYYLYAKVPIESGTEGEYLLSETSIDMTSEKGYYYFLVGILNSEYNGTREFVSLYGFTEVLPGQITTELIKSADGNAVLDLVNGLLKFGNKVGLSGASSEETNLRMWAGKEESEKESAPFRVYDDGSVYANLLQLLNGCKIGSSIKIEDNAIVIDLPNNNARLMISEMGIWVEGEYGASIGNCSGAAIQGIAKGGAWFCPKEDKGIGVHGEAKDGEYAFFSRSGVFAGLRPKAKVISSAGTSSSPNVLDDLDYSVFVNLTSGTCYIDLPQTPLDGQEYYIESRGANMAIHMYQAGYSLYSGNTSAVGYTVMQTGRALLRFKYYKDAGIWVYSWLNK